jgi:hypothetical protein
MDRLAITASVRSGNSGSGVFDAAGRLVGVVVELRWCSVADAYIGGNTCGGYASILAWSGVIQ